MTTIVQKGDPVLRMKAEEVPETLIKSPKIKGIIKKMKSALEREIDGVAIAAPQIGEALRIFVISKRAFEVGKSESAKKKEGQEEERDVVFINPRIIKKSKETAFVDEGCLSVRWYYGLVKRAKRVTIEAFNEKGEKFHSGRGGLLAQIFQHETDHLDGVLFTDKAKDLVEIPPQNLSDRN